MLIDLFPYLFVLLLTAVVPKLFKKKTYMFVLFVLLFVFSGFRYGVGWDYFNYYDTVISADWRLYRMEYLIRKLALFCYDNKTPILFFIVTSFVTLFCYFYTISKESIDKPASLMVFLCLPCFFLTSLTTIRFSLAVAMIFLAYHFFREKKFWLCILIVVAAFFVHRATLFAILTIPFLVWNVSFSNRTNFTILIVCIIIGTFFSFFSVFSSVADSALEMLNNEDMSQSVENYMDIQNGGFSRTPFIYAIIDVLVLFALNDRVRGEKDEKVGFYVTMFNLGCSITFLLSFNPTLASRLSLFFMVYLILAVPYINKKSWQSFLLFSIFIVFFLLQLSVRGTHPDFIGRFNCFLPYRIMFSY